MMKRTFLALSFLALALLVVLIVGAGLGAAQTSGPVPDARPTPTPLAPVPEMAPQAPLEPEIPPLPDLIVSRIEVLPSTPVKGQVATIRVTFENQADYSVVPTNNFWSDLYVDPAVVPIRLGQDGVAEWGLQGYWLPAGGSYVTETEVVFDKVKTYSLFAQVDTDGNVLESNEGNNVLGPVVVQVRATNEIVHQTHEEFQLGMASSLDVSHPEGVMRQGIFVQPLAETNVYAPDFAINDPTDVNTDTGLSQVKPALTSGVYNSKHYQFVVWEDGRDGGLFNRRIYFSRSLDGEAWNDETRVDQASDPTAATFNQVSPDLVYDPDTERLYAVWQDNRDQGDYDIYFAYSADGGLTWTVGSEPLNDDADPPASQLNPSIAVGPSITSTEPSRLYVVWQDRRNGNDDVYMVRSDDGGLNWGPNYFVTDDPETTAQNQSAPSVAVDDPVGWVYVGWEDWRDPAHPEIYVIRSEDEGKTFGLDVPITIVRPEDRTTYRTQPTLRGNTTVEAAIYPPDPPAHPTTYTVNTTISVIHVAWQDGQRDNADIYYSYSAYDHDPENATPCPWPYKFCFTPPQKVSGFVMDSAYVRPPGDTSFWPIEPSWQGQVSLDLVPDNTHFTLCHADSTEIYSKGVAIAWSDARSYDDWRYEIRTRRVASPKGDARTYEVCEDGWVGMVNSNAKLYALRDDPDLYEIYKPSATGPANPSIRVDESGVYVAWDDDRWDNPSLQGQVRNRDVFASRIERIPQGIYISPVIDGRTDAPKWYVLSWYGVTQDDSDLLFQTRFGNDDPDDDFDRPNPPKGNVETNFWTKWTGNASSSAYVGPSSDWPDCPTDTRRGEGCVYDAPGRTIVRPDGSDWFESPDGDQYRYMQYKVIIRGHDRLTALSQVAIQYEGAATTVYLPIVLRNH